MSQHSCNLTDVKRNFNNITLDVFTFKNNLNTMQMYLYTCILEISSIAMKLFRIEIIFKWIAVKE